MKRQRLPKILLFMIASVRLMSYAVLKDLTIVEWFSGVGHIKTASAQHGLSAETFEIRDDSLWQDMCSPHGFVEALMVCSA